MPENNQSPSSFDVDKELEELLKNVRSQNAAPQNSTPARPAPSRPAPVRPTPQRPVPPRSVPRPKIVTKTNNGIKMYEDKTDYKKMSDKDASFYTGEVYFAAKKPVHPEPALAQGLHQPAKPGSRANEMRQGGGKLSLLINNFLHEGGKKAAIIYVAILVVIAVLFSLYTMSLVNDILAFNRDDEVKTITVGENATTGQVISQLDKAGLIKHGTFCKVFMGLTKSLHEVSGKPVYLSGVYYLTPNMGLEKMLLSCQEIKSAETVTVTIPEGYNIEQIAKKLEKSGVCMSDEFYNNIEKADFSYDFLKGIENKSSRYEYLEGYIFPDTYEFYVGQNASSVINKMLETFESKWTKEFAAQAKAMGMTEDEVIILASIVQKEAADSEQMPVIAKIFINRLKSSEFPSLQSDATNIYVDRYIKPNATAGDYDSYWTKYSTYKCVGLPAGPICCPGIDAIKAVLWPADTDAYYFCHDSAGNIYTAKTEAEHQANYYKALSGTQED